MYYVEDQDPILVKQEVNLDETALKKLYQELLLKFGRYVHRAYDSAIGPYHFQKSLGEDFKYIKNYSETPLSGGDGRRDPSSVEGDVTLEPLGKMHYEYDEYVIPELAKWITRLLEGDVSVIDELKKGPVVKGSLTGSEEEQRRLHRELQDLLNSAPTNMDADKFRQLTEQISRFYLEETDEEDLKEQQEYYGKVLACIHFKSVKTLYKDKWNELRRVYKDVKEFYEGTGQFEDKMKNL